MKFYEMIKTNGRYKKDNLPNMEVQVPPQPLNHENHPDTKTEMKLSVDDKDELVNEIISKLSGMNINQPKEITLSEEDKNDIFDKISSEISGLEEKLNRRISSEITGLQESLKESQNVDITNIIKNSEPQEAPPEYENNELDDDQIAEVLNTMLAFQDEYFSATPLNSELVQKFVWNIPKDIYKAHSYVKDHELPDAMDPIYWFYLFCMKNPQEAMGKFIVQAINSMSDTDFEEISQDADEYDEM
jgi:hypothetical protein